MRKLCCRPLVVALFCCPLCLLRVPMRIMRSRSWSWFWCIDQFRGDYLDRYRDDFKTANGFNLFLKRGAYFTDCYYDYANTMTAPGHSTIGTGRVYEWTWNLAEPMVGSEAFDDSCGDLGRG